MSRIRLAQVAIAVGSLTAVAAAAWALVPPRETVPVTASEARAAFASIESVTLAPDGPDGFQALCTTWADDTTLCRASLAEVGDRSPVEPARLRGVRLLDDGTALIDVAGVDREGQPFQSTLQLVRAGDRVRAVDPVYWVDRVIEVSEEGVTPPATPATEATATS